MIKREYSAGMVKMSFWFSEYKKVISLLNSGMSLSEIKVKNASENIFAAPTEARSAQIYATVSKRVKFLDYSFYSLFEETDIANQKLIVLISIMASDSLFFDFMYEVFREKLIIGTDEISNRDISVYLKDKQIQDERVAKWMDNTLKRLGNCYKTILSEAGVLERQGDPRKISRPIIDSSLEQLLQDMEMKEVLQTLTGVR